MMKLEELKGKRIVWDATPQSEGGTIEIRGQEEYDRFIQRLKERAGYYFYVNVWNCTAKLAVMHQRGDGSATSDFVETDIVTDDDLVDAIEQAGGAINISGQYPASMTILKKLKAALE